VHKQNRAQKMIALHVSGLLASPPDEFSCGSGFLERLKQHVKQEKYLEALQRQDPATQLLEANFSDRELHADGDFERLSALVDFDSRGKLGLGRRPVYGRYVFAKEALKRGQVVLIAPAVHFKKPSDIGIVLMLPAILDRLPDLYRLTARAVERLRDITTARLLKDWLGLNYPARALSIIKNNCFDTLNDERVHGVSLSVTGSMFQHSCKANMFNHFQDDGNEVFTCLRDISAGEELCIAYTMDCSATRGRWGFECAETSHAANQRCILVALMGIEGALQRARSSKEYNIRVPAIDTIELLHAAMDVVVPGIEFSVTKEFAEGMMKLKFASSFSATSILTEVGSACEACSAPSASYCAQCKTVAYCSKACQRRHWKEGGHKEKCLWAVFLQRIYDSHAQFGAY